MSFFFLMIQHIIATYDTKGRQHIKKGREKVVTKGSDERREDVRFDQAASSKDLLCRWSKARFVISRLETQGS